MKFIFKRLIPCHFYHTQTQLILAMWHKWFHKIELPIQFSSARKLWNSTWEKAIYVFRSWVEGKRKLSTHNEHQALAAQLVSTSPVGKIYCKMIGASLNYLCFSGVVWDVELVVHSMILVQILSIAVKVALLSNLIKFLMSRYRITSAKIKFYFCTSLTQAWSRCFVKFSNLMRESWGEMENFIELWCRVIMDENSIKLWLQT